MVKKASGKFYPENVTGPELPRKAASKGKHHNKIFLF
jgi:hypothetical protein